MCGERETWEHHVREGCVGGRKKQAWQDVVGWVLGEEGEGRLDEGSREDKGWEGRGCGGRGGELMKGVKERYVMRSGRMGVSGRDWM